tara:strand:+ start:9467 stop:9952 length:486 start_codon:yes stop_codon:yes gene_type:complete
MADLTAAVLNVDKNLTSGERYIFLGDGDFDGGVGEGDSFSGGGPDFIDIYAALGRRGSKIDILLAEATGGPGDVLMMQLWPNARKKLYKHDYQLQRTPIPQPWPILADVTEVTTTSNPILIMAASGNTVTWSYNGPPFANLMIGLQIIGAAAVAGMTINIS